MKLNVGCGRNIERGEDWINLDMSEDVGANCVFDLNDIDEIGRRLPFEDNTFSLITMSHVLEHLSTPLPIMEELYRVAKPECQFVIRVPYGSSDIAFEDPTHVRQYFANSFMYFSQPAYARADYGYRGDWQVQERVLVFSDSINPEVIPEDPRDVMDMVNSLRNIIQEFVCVLTAVKPIREVTEACTQGPIRFAFSSQLKGVA